MSKHPLLAACSLFLLPLFAACGGTAASDNAREVLPTGSVTTAVATAAASAAPVYGSGGDDLPFMKIGDITPAAAEVAPSAAPIPPPPPNVDPTKRGKSFTSPLPAGAAASAAATAEPGRNERKAEDEGGSEKPKPQAAVVDSNGGLSEAEVRSTIVQKQSSFRECYNLGAAGAASFSGTVQLRVSIGPTGSVATCEVLSSTTKNAQVDSCVTQAIRRIQFPAKGSGAVVAFPIEFGQ